MALLTYSASPAKGSTTTVTLDKAEIANLSADAWWQDWENLTQVLVTLKSSPGNAKILLAFDVDDSPCTAQLAMPQHTRDVFEIYKVVLIDDAGDTLTVPRSSIPSAVNYDIDMGVPVSLLGLTASSDLIQWYKADSITGLLDNADVSGLSESSGHSWAVTANLVNTGVSSTKPKFLSNQINGKPALKFNDASAYLGCGVDWTTKITSANNYSMHSFSLVKRAGTPSGSWWISSYDLNSPTGGLLGVQILGSAQTPAYGIRALYTDLTGIFRDAVAPSALPLNDWTIIEFIKSGSTITVKTHNSAGTQSVSEVQGSSSPATGIGSPRFVLGKNSPGAGALYYLAEFATYRKALSAAERSEVLAYLTGKYAIPTT